MKTIRYNIAALGAGAVTVALSIVGTSVLADSHSIQKSDTNVASGLVLPVMDAANGRRLFASKGCVVCHSVNGVGGEDAPMLDAEFMDQPMNPFDFAANMWRGAETMVRLQQDELGGVVQMTGQELADITAFVHDPQEQARFSVDDIPEDILSLIEHNEAEEQGDAHD